MGFPSSVTGTLPIGGEIVSDGGSKKHVSRVTYEPITLVCRHMKPGFYNWLGGILAKTDLVRDLTISLLDDEDKESGRWVIERARLLEMRVSTITRNAKRAPAIVIKLLPERARIERGGGWKPAPYKSVAGTGFRFRATQLDTRGVSRIAPVTVEVIRNNTTVHQKPSDCVIRLPIGRASPWYDWLEQMMESQNSAHEQTGTLDVLDSVGNPVWTLGFQGLGIYRIERKFLSTRTVDLRMYVERVTLAKG